jgi:hypothetical protein
MTAVIVGSAQIAGNGTSLTCNKPTDTADGDLMIAFQFDDYGTYAAMTAPAGWAAITGLDRGSNLLHFKSWSKVAASEGASYIFQQGSGNPDGVLLIVTIRGAINTSGTWIWSTPVWTATGTPRVTPTVAGILPGGILLCSASADMNNVTAAWTAPSDMVSLGAPQSTTYGTMCVAGMASAANPSGTKSFAVTGAQFGTSGGIEWAIGLQPLVSAGQFMGLF